MLKGHSENNKPDLGKEEAQLINCSQ